MENNNDAKLQLKRLVLDVPLELHTEVKKRAATRNISIKIWISRAIINAIKEEKKYE